MVKRLLMISSLSFALSAHAATDLSQLVAPSGGSTAAPPIPVAALPVQAPTTAPETKQAGTQTQASNQKQPAKKKKQPKMINEQEFLKNEAFRKVLNDKLPLDPKKIHTLRKKMDENEEAFATPPKAPPRPMSSTITVDLSPGVTPPVVRLGAGFISSLVFVDVTGQSWPVADFSLGDPKSFNISWDKQTNTLFVQSLIKYASANLAVRLADLDTPIMLSLVTGQREVDYRVDLQVRARGPNALAPIVGDNLPTSAHGTLLSVLDGVPPQGSIELNVAGAYGRAWRTASGRMILRTKLAVLSPAWHSTVSSPDGTKVYEMMQTPLVLATKDGEPVKIHIKGY